jgi:hypothetical protein
MTPGEVVLEFIELYAKQRSASSDGLQIHLDVWEIW